MSLTTLPDEVTSLQTLAKQDEIVPGMLDMGTDHLAERNYHNRERGLAQEGFHGYCRPHY